MFDEPPDVPCPACDEVDGHKDGCLVDHYFAEATDLRIENERLRAREAELLAACTAEVERRRVAGLQPAWERIAYLREKNARHRKGWRLSERDARTVLFDLTGEVDELRYACDNNCDELHELADVLNVCLQFAQLRGFTIEQVNAAMVEKLASRFSVEG